MTDVNPIIIVGAPRSGTNILRDVLTAGTTMTTWPCDEINYIWRHGNRSVDHDEFDASHATDKVRRYVRRAFERQAKRGGTPNVVEKTCATTLRVPFVDAIFPEARYIVIERDPIDAIASAMHRWKAPLDRGYLAAKMRWVPPTDLPYYATRYAVHRLKKTWSDNHALPTWGPRFRGIDDAVAQEPLHLVCTRQWARCVQASREAVASLQPGRVHHVAYAEMVSSPEATLADTVQFAVGGTDAFVSRAARGKMSTKSLGRGRSELPDELLQDIVEVLQAEAA